MLVAVLFSLQELAEGLRHDRRPLVSSLQKLKDQYEYASDSFRDPPAPVESDTNDNIETIHSSLSEVLQLAVNELTWVFGGLYF